MSDCDFPRRRFPCDECPIRADNASNPDSKFPAERWRALTASVQSPGGFGPDFGSPLFGCHKGRPRRADEMATLTVRRAWTSLVPYVGDPFVYMWRVAVEQSTNRWVSGESWVEHPGMGPRTASDRMEKP